MREQDLPESSHLVDFVEHEDRILVSARRMLNNLSRQGADVSSPVATNLGLVVHATQEMRTNFRPSARVDLPLGLAHARSPHEHRIGPFIPGFRRRTER